MANINAPIRDALFRLKPDEYRSQYLGSYELLMRNYHLIIGIAVKEETFRHVLDLVCDVIAHRKNIKKLKLLKILRHLLRNNPDMVCDTACVTKLFELYKTHVRLSTYANVANGLLMGKKLDHEQLSWLVENVEEDEHSLNRLLRYPFISKVIAQWAAVAFRDRKFGDRISEILGLLVTNDKDWQVLRRIKNPPVAYWALYYAKLPSKDKEAALETLFSQRHAEDWAEVCVRLELPSLLEKKLRSDGNDSDR